MIEIKNLTKTYKVENNKQHALNNVSFNLPSKGMVFVLGKSGSGKTTLMNLIGGLASPTSGQIIVDGNEISSFDEHQFNTYRNSHVGFIFQDFFLLENYTIKENVDLNLKLQNKHDDELVKKTLSMVDLAGLEDRYPSEISGGQKQRVAIARAIIKNPKLILADEPTGNLDYRTSATILELLKELSKDRLILIVSHNKQEAYKYADILLKLDNGQIKSIHKRNDNIEESLIIDNVINVPYNVRLSKSELNQINQCAKTGKYTFTQNLNRFDEINQIEAKKEEITFASYKLNQKNTNYFSKKFNKETIKQTILSSFVVAIMIVLLIISFTFSLNNGEEIINHVNNFSDINTTIILKGYYDEETSLSLQKNASVKFESEEFESFYEEGYEGNIYKIYNYPVIFNLEGSSVSFDNYYMPHLSINVFTSLYVKDSFGTIECNENFLKQLFADENGNIKLIAGSLEKGFKDNGIVLTDYAADCMRFTKTSLAHISKQQACEELVNSDTINGRYTIKAIIDTGYENKYSRIIELFKMTEDASKVEEAREELAKLKNSEEFYKFVNDIKSTLAMTYYIGEGSFKDVVIKDKETTYKKIVNGRNYYQTEYSSSNEQVATFSLVYDETLNLNDGEVYMDYRKYNDIFSKNLKNNDFSDFKEENITITYYDHLDKTGGNEIYSKTYKVVGVRYDVPSYVNVSENDMNELINAKLFEIGACFDNVQSITKTFKTNNSNFKLHYINNDAYTEVYKITNIFSSFKFIFTIIFILLIVASFITLCSHINKCVKQQTYDIGVLKGIGLKSNVILNIYLRQIALLSTLIIAIVSIFMLFVENGLNTILIANLKEYLPEILTKDMKVIDIKIQTILGSYIYVILISVITIMLLINKLKKIKPINIIKSKEL